MKKLMIAAAIVCAAAFAHAATYNWQAGADCVTTDGSTYENYIGDSSVYFFVGDGAVRTAVMTALAGNDLTVLDNALSSAKISASDYGVFNLEGSNFSAADSATTISGFAVFLDAQKAADAKFAFATDALSVDVSDAIKGGQAAQFAFGMIETEYTSGWTKIESVPEPTSGLLLLLGVAGLALKRRRA